MPEKQGFLDKINIDKGRPTLNGAYITLYGYSYNS